MRVRIFALATLVCGPVVGLACIPNPKADFEDYQAAVIPYRPEAGGGSFDGAAATEAFEGTFFGACLSQLAQNNPDKVFNFLTDVKFTPGAGGGQLVFKLTPLKTDQTPGPDQGRVPPKVVSRANITGTVLGSDTAVATDARGKFTAVFGDVNVPGDANPISQRPVIILNGGMVGIFSQSSGVAPGSDGGADEAGTDAGASSGGAQFTICTRLNGDVTQPLTLTLDPTLNICQFRQIKEGDPAPVFTKADFQSGTCPVD
jgi:hypothetical protein